MPEYCYHITTCTDKRRPLFLSYNWLIQLNHRGSLSDALKLLKGRSSRSPMQACNVEGAVWQKGFYDHAMRRDEDLVAVSRYIVANPLRAGLVQRIGDYPFWDSVYL